MFGQKQWTLGLATSVCIASVAATSGVVALAHRFVDELSSPHKLPYTPEQLGWKLPEQEVEPPLANQRAVLFRTSDGKLLQGDFWAQPHPAPTVIICHGYRISRSILRPVGALEYRHGYNILLFDFRGHGGSESAPTGGGNVEVRDLEAAIAVASQQPETIAGKVILHGFSMGAAVALLTLPHPDVIAVIADSPYARLGTILRSLICWQLSQICESWHPLLRPLGRVVMPLSWVTVAVSTLDFRLRFGYRLMANPARRLKHWHRRATAARGIALPPILLIHGTSDAYVPISHAHQIVTQAQAHHIPLETYFAEGSKHGDCYGDYPQEYIHRLRNFLAKHLGDDFPRELPA